MKVFGRYFKHHFFASATRLLVMTILAVLFVGAILSSTLEGLKHLDSTDYGYIYYTCGLYSVALVLGALCAVVPIFELSGFKNRRNLDAMFSAPIDRKELAMVHYLNGLCQVLIPYTVAFLYALCRWLPNGAYFDLIYLLPYYFLSVLIGFLTYSIFTFLFERANTVADGVVCMVLQIFAVQLVLVSIDECFSRPDSVLGGDHFNLFSPINDFTTLFQDLIDRDGTRWSLAAVEEGTVAWILFAVAGIAAIYGYVRNFANRRAETAGATSDSWFGYKLLIPVYGFFLNLFMGDGSLVFGILIVVAMVIGYIIYRRSFRLKRWDIILSLASLLITFLLAIPM